MDDRLSFHQVDSVLFELAFQTQGLSQKKNELNEQIKVFRADIAGTRSCIETLHRDTRTLEEEIRVKQSTVIHNTTIAESMKVANSLILQYEQTLKEELESRMAIYNHEMDFFEERIAVYRKTFQSYKECCYEIPLAQKLFTLQAEKEETESRIKTCDDQITMKQKELDHLTGPAVSSSSIEKLPDSVSDHQPITEPEKQSDPHTVEENDSSTVISSLQLNQTKISQNGQKTSVEANAEEVCEENKVQDTTASSHFPSQQLDEQTWQDVMQNEKQDQETGPEDQVLEQQSPVVDMEEAVEQEEMEGVTEYVQAPSKEDKGLSAFPESSPQETNPQPFSATVEASFDFSPGSSPHQGTSDAKSPVFLFSVNSDASTMGISDFGFDSDLLQDEDSFFTSTSSFFMEKNSTESKSSSFPEFLFSNQEQSEDFHLALTFSNSQTTKEDNTRDKFPFSFNFSE